jgi:integrating conjugative element protein (TIGR03752 family)
MNKFIPILLGAVVIIVLVIGWLSFGGDEPGTQTDMSASNIAVPPLPEGKVSNTEAANLKAANSYAAQMQGATGQILSLERKINSYVSDTDRRITEEAEKILRLQLPAIEKRLREDIRRENELGQATRLPTGLPASRDSNRVVDPILSTSDTALKASQTSTSGRMLNPALADIPSGLGFDNLSGSVSLPFDALSSSSAGSLRAGGRSVHAEAAHPGYTRITAWQPSQPLPGTNPAGRMAASASSVLDTQSTAGAATKSNTKDAKPKPIPIYTIEDTATLFSNTTMTALMGVVPNKSNAVKNLMRFKVITGSENIASNGLLLPDVKNIIWTGYAIGNREMECVQATVDTATFTFQDGTIRTVKKKQSGSSGQLSEGLGYLSDQWGKPCIKGTLISNAAQYLRDRMIAAGAAATASASAAMQTTTSRDALGGSSTTVTGSEGEFIAGQTGTATLNELAAYLRDRMDQAVDIVYLDAGKDVVIHVEEQVDIDYDPAGRKLSHIVLSQQAVRARKARLD